MKMLTPLAHFSSTFYAERMFQTADDWIYYRDKNQEWFVEKEEQRLLMGGICVGSIDPKKIEKLRFTKLEELLIYLGEGLKDTSPKELVPYFEIGSHPLTLEKSSTPSDKYPTFYIGQEIVKVYKSI